MGSPLDDDGARWLRRLLIAGFLAALLPLVSGELRYHGDERFYTDGALHMLNSGDYLTPAYADGRPRFVKPGLSYWLIAGSFKALGAGLASSRLPSLLAGAGVLWLAGRAVLALGGSESAAFLAVAVLASNMSLLLASVRATPDALLCLFLSMSAFGFLRIIVREERGRSTYALAYLGAGLAIAVKGLLGLFPIVFSFLFCALGRRRGAPSPRVLVHGPLMAAGAAVGLSWFAAVVLVHGPAAWAGFFADQVAGKVEASRLRALANVPRYLLAAVQHFLPWSALAAFAWFAGRHHEQEGGKARRLSAWYALGFAAVMVAIFSAGRDLRPRYLLPVYPLVSVVLAPWLERRLEAARREWRAAVAGTALLVIAALPLNDLLITPMFDEQPARLVAVRIAALAPPPPSVALLGMGGEFAGQLSLHLQGRVRVTALNRVPAPGAAPLPAVLVSTEPRRAELLGLGYRVLTCGYVQPRWTAREIWQATVSHDFPSVSRQRRIPVLLAVRGKAGSPGD